MPLKILVAQINCIVGDVSSNAEKIFSVVEKAKSDGGVGAALGGGMTESAFGADTNNVLSKSTINTTIAFFVLSFVLYLGHIYQRNHAVTNEDCADPPLSLKRQEIVIFYGPVDHTDRDDVGCINPPSPARERRHFRCYL